MNLSLNNQIAIITGASSGIGAGVAHALAEEGATVVINYPDARGREIAQKVLDDISANGGKGILSMADVSKEDEVINMFAEVIKKLGTSISS